MVSASAARKRANSGPPSVDPEYDLSQECACKRIDCKWNAYLEMQSLRPENHGAPIWLLSTSPMAKNRLTNPPLKYPASRKVLLIQRDFQAELGLTLVGKW